MMNLEWNILEKKVINMENILVQKEGLESVGTGFCHF